uniref:Alcohol dehydrogenase 3 n=1 Tax=Tanacetum cinerariifolium TaxID=118510 RepID=A0A4P8JG13_TANCI|nr:alcohol dehydrogenase 3 [Tanacetum cinerariifolium]
MEKSPDLEHPIKAYGYAARDTSGTLSPLTFSRRTTRDKDVRFRVLYCGICHTDIHFVKDELGMSSYPFIPGHEIVGVVTEVGREVEKIKIGDKVGVGFLVGSCNLCEMCANENEQYCAKLVMTSGSPNFDGTYTYGGYSDHMVCEEHFVLRWPDNLPLDSGAPLLCAGITSYAPLKKFGLDKPGMKVGVVGLGGVGHVAVKMAKAFGLEVTVFSTSPAKKQEALEVLKADNFINSRDEEQMQVVMDTLDGVIDTVSVNHAITPLLNVLKPNGKLIVVGLPEKSFEVSAAPLVSGGKIVAGSMIGGLKDTQEMLDFAAKHGVTADIEIIPIDYVNTAMDRILKSDVRYRFVIDVANSLSASLSS